MHIIRLPLSIDHQKKKAISIYLPFFIYLHFVTSQEFETLLPDALAQRLKKAKAHFFQENRFFSDAYQDDYVRHPYIRLLCGPDVHKFLVKVLSLNYQTHRPLLNEEAGSFTEFFADFDLFWNDNFRSKGEGLDEGQLRDVLFCQACIRTQYERINEKKTLRDKLDDFAKAELAAKEDKIQRLEKKLQSLREELADMQGARDQAVEELAHAQRQNMVLVPSDPHYMLGLQPDEADKVEKRSRALLKALHPDRTGTPETAYLFDLIVKSRDMALK